MRAVPIATWRSMNLPPAPVRNLVARLPRWEAPPEPCVGLREWTIELDALDRELSQWRPPRSSPCEWRPSG
jgi:hypothetical protein